MGKYILNNLQIPDISLSVLIFNSVPSWMKELPLDCTITEGHATKTDC